jgi:hypothetical protein
MFALGIEIIIAGKPEGAMLVVKPEFKQRHVFHGGFRRWGNGGYTVAR